MTLTDIIIRDLEICRREEEAEAAKQEIERAQRRKRQRGIISDICGAIAFAAMMIAFLWLCCACSGYNWQ